jgi:hypothetical protein
VTPNKVIYVINQSTELRKAWRELSEVQKRILLKECEMAEEDDIGAFVVLAISRQNH